MRQDKYYKLNVFPITDTTASLVNIHVDSNSGLLAIQANYNGYEYYRTPNELHIEYGEFNGKIYKITEIKETAFSHCRDLKTIRIGKSIEVIEWNMYCCVSLQNIFVDKDNSIFYDIDGVLFKGKELVAFPQGRTGSYVIPDGIKKIRKHAFKSCALSEIVFPDSLREIGINAFYECNKIREFVLPASIKKIHSNMNAGNKTLTQKFYLSSDINKSTPLSIDEIMKMYPA